ncbi:DNA and RNA helicase [Paenibacillus woosongensis]|uniref:DNA and RNA helicase n=1 Tax=Paenibacillus woosongensis TaxID=307580 RepID=A0A7X3CLC5_9BACL|nr:DNA and RNA helicase [Paenibacillus woosongensis]MUG44338.1 DNA and RNA helicase [Paenibacillus woosongensis]
MFNHIVPKFEKGRILKTAMLENLRDFPRDFVDVYYHEYTDGIISGAHVEVGADSLIVHPGIVKHQGRLYLLTDAVSIKYRATGREAALKVRFHAGDEDGDWQTFRSEIVIDEQLEADATELELCRFKLKEGARLRQDYQGFRDLATEFNTVNVLHVRYAAYGKSTLSPVILRSFAEEMMRKGSGDPQDFMFTMMCMNEGTLARDVILHYMTSRLGMSSREYTNVEIHKYLGRILDGVRGGGGGRLGMAPGGSQRVIVD